VTFAYVLTVYLGYVPPFPPSPSSPSLLPRITSTSFTALFHKSIQSPTTIFALLHPLHSPSPSHTHPELDLFYLCPSFIKAHIHCSKGFCHGILPVNIS
jgi:hypothetical protein